MWRCDRQSYTIGSTEDPWFQIRTDWPQHRRLYTRNIEENWTGTMRRRWRRSGLRSFDACRVFARVEGDTRRCNDRRSATPRTRCPPISGSTPSGTTIERCDGRRSCRTVCPGTWRIAAEVSIPVRKCRRWQAPATRWWSSVCDCGSRGRWTILYFRVFQRWQSAWPTRVRTLFVRSASRCCPMTSQSMSHWGNSGSTCHSSRKLESEIREFASYTSVFRHPKLI